MFDIVLRVKHALSQIGRCFVWLYRLPYRRGYGIHSPFAYNLVTRVVYERSRFYAYAPLHGQRAKATLREKDDRLLLRLVNDFQPTCCVVLGAEAEVTLRYLRAGCRRCTYWEGQKLPHGMHPDMLLVLPRGAEANVLEEVLRQMQKRSLVVVCGTHCSAAGRRLWQAVLQSEREQIVFDLYDICLAYTTPTLTPAHYTVSYM